MAQYCSSAMFHFARQHQLEAIYITYPSAAIVPIYNFVQIKQVICFLVNCNFPLLLSQITVF